MVKIGINGFGRYCLLSSTKRQKSRAKETKRTKGEETDRDLTSFFLFVIRCSSELEDLCVVRPSTRESRLQQSMIHSWNLPTWFVVVLICFWFISLCEKWLALFLSFFTGSADLLALLVFLFLQAYLLKYDTAHGRYPAKIKVEKDALIIDGKKVNVYSKWAAASSALWFGFIVVSFFLFSVLSSSTNTGRTRSRSLGDSSASTMSWNALVCSKRSRPVNATSRVDAEKSSSLLLPMMPPCLSLASMSRNTSPPWLVSSKSKLALWHPFFLVLALIDHFGLLPFCSCLSCEQCFLHDQLLSPACESDPW